MKLRCTECGKEYDSAVGRWQCDCGGYIEFISHPVFHKEMIKKDRMNMWRYDEAYPIKYEELKVTYNEGMTPLVPLNKKLGNIRVKMDSLMPTGSYKDRGTVMVINYLLNNGVEKITEDSSGNAGASVAGYSALASIPCDIFVPKGNSSGKIAQIKAYGANIHEIEGTREDVAEAAQEDKKDYAGHNWHPMMLEGTKSLAYEIWEQLGYRAPENVVIVVGNGSAFLGLYYGFKVLLDNHEIERMPRLFAVQSEKCNPICRRYNNNDSNEGYDKTIAEGISIRKPNKVREILKALNETNGKAISVKEDEIRKAIFILAENGIFAEPTSSAGLAGLLKLREEGKIEKDDETILVITGNGLKATQEIMELKGQEK